MIIERTNQYTKSIDKNGLQRIYKHKPGPKSNKFKVPFFSKYKFWQWYFKSEERNGNPIPQSQQYKYKRKSEYQWVEDSHNRRVDISDPSNHKVTDINGNVWESSENWEVMRYVYKD